MQSFETRIGSRLVRSILNAGRWSSRLYVNEGETATLSTAKHKTEAAARKWAEKVLAS